jgi:hypothetical protein
MAKIICFLSGIAKITNFSYREILEKCFVMFYVMFPLSAKQGEKFGNVPFGKILSSQKSSNLDGGGAVFCLHAPLLPGKVGVLAA